MKERKKNTKITTEKMPAQRFCVCTLANRNIANVSMCLFSTGFRLTENKEYRQSLVPISTIHFQCVQVMESNNDYRQLCKVPRSNYWHAAKHIFTLILFLFFLLLLSIFWPLLCSCGHRKFVSFMKLCRHWCSSWHFRAYEKCD